MGELQQTSDPQLADSMSLWPVEIAASEPSAVKVRDLTLEWLEYYTQIPAGPRPIGYPVSFQKDFKDSTTRPSAYLVPVDPRPNPSWSTSSWNRIQQIGSQSRPEAELKPDFHIEPLLRPTTTCRGVRLSRGYY